METHHPTNLQPETDGEDFKDYIYICQVMFSVHSVAWFYFATQYSTNNQNTERDSGNENGVNFYNIHNYSVMTAHARQVLSYSTLQSQNAVITHLVKSDFKQKSDFWTFVLSCKM